MKKKKEERGGGKKKNMDKPGMGFSGMRGWTPSMASQCIRMDGTKGREGIPGKKENEQYQGHKGNEEKKIYRKR